MTIKFQKPIRAEPLGFVCEDVFHLFFLRVSAALREEEGLVALSDYVKLL
jgi:hypothetical protein